MARVSVEASGLRATPWGLKMKISEFLSRVLESFSLPLVLLKLCNTSKCCSQREATEADAEFIVSHTHLN